MDNDLLLQLYAALEPLLALYGLRPVWLDQPWLGQFFLERAAGLWMSHAKQKDE